MAVVFDIETDGLLDTVSRIHCLRLIDLSDGREYLYTDEQFFRDPKTCEVLDVPTPRDGTLLDGLDHLRDTDCVIGHNIIGFDLPVLRMLMDEEFRPKKVRDTKLMSTVIYPHLIDVDQAQSRKGLLKDMPKNMLGTHRLAAWGIRMGGERKQDFSPSTYGHTWETVPYSQVMDEYCAADVRVNVALWERLNALQYSESCLSLEHSVAEIIHQQWAVGFQFDRKAAEALAKDLVVERANLHDQLTLLYEPWLAPDGPQAGRVTPKRTMRKFIEHPEGAHVHPKKGVRGYYEKRMVGCPATKVKQVVFNPGSRDHIANRLQVIEGWVPTEFTPEGKPKVDEAVLAALPYPAAKKLSEYFRLTKMLGQLAEGKQAWLNSIKSDGRIHGSVNTNGTVTGRMSHSHPNVAQVDKDHRMRSLWIARPKYKLVGCDAEGLELRIMAHYMARYDDGEYANVVVNGRKEDESDVHNVNKRALDLRLRDTAKTYIYALIYGAGDWKLGTIIVDDFDPEQQARFYSQYPEGPRRKAAFVRLGKKSRERIMKAFPALALLTRDVQEVAKRRGWLRGLDGRRLHIRGVHSALNTLFQSGGAVAMKMALVTLSVRLQQNGFLLPRDGSVKPYDVAFVANVHDEFQMEVVDTLGLPDEVGQMAADAIREAGEILELRCPLAGSYDVGLTWADTH